MTKKLSLSIKKILINKIKDKYKKAKKRDKAIYNRWCGWANEL